MARIIRTPEALNDLAEIWEYIGANNPGAADRLLDNIDEKVKLIAESPYIGREREELAPGIRSFPAGRYLIFYSPIAGGMEIVRVLHGSRDVDTIISEE
jgi:toxin ParE1/3/4